MNSATTRIGTSVSPPAANGTMSVMGCVGQLSPAVVGAAVAPPVGAVVPPPPQAAATRLRTIGQESTRASTVNRRIDTPPRRRLGTG